jgi:hypothetical protein
MATHLSVGTVIEKNKISSDVAFLVMLKIEINDPNTRSLVETIHLVKNTENILYDGQTYTAANFDFSFEQRQNETPSITLTAKDHIGFIQSRLDAYAGAVFSEVVLIVLNSARLNSPPEMEERFQILTSSVKNYEASFSLGAENLLNVKFPPRTQYQDRCAWRYKGYGCSYTGSMPSCSYTKDGANGCTAHSNAINFKGLPGLVSMNI